MHMLFFRNRINPAAAIGNAYAYIEFKVMHHLCVLQMFL
jgi:hypothetical protein